MPFMAPQMTKFSLAPCHNPPKTIVINRFRSRWIYFLKLTKSNENRKIPIKQILREEALKAFEIWSKKVDKIKY